MNVEAFKLARQTLRTAVREYGWGRAPRYGSTLTTDSNARLTYRAPLGWFEGEHWAIVHYYDAVMNGCAGEPLGDGDHTDADLLEVSDVERLAFQFKADTQFVALWYSDSGFVTLEELTCKRYDELRAQYEGNSDE